MPLWRRGRVVRQRPAKPRTAVRVRSSPSPRVWPHRLGRAKPAPRALVPLAALHSATRADALCRLAALASGTPDARGDHARLGGSRASPPRGARALAVAAACGTQEQSEPAAQLVPQLSDLPAGYDAVPAESFPVQLETVLADPRSAGIGETIRRERLSGYQTSFASPTSQRFECSAALVPLGRGAARTVFSLADAPRSSMPSLTDRVAGPVGCRADRSRDTCLSITTSAASMGPRVAWRSRACPLSCVAARLRDVPDLAELLVVARAQQRGSRSPKFRQVDSAAGGR